MSNPPRNLRDASRTDDITFSENGATFEEAISATKYGKFQILLFLAIIPGSWATAFDTSNISMILSEAKCELQLGLIHKGILNGVIYAGMVSAAMIWGFIGDVVGRRRVLVYGLLADGICNVLSGIFAQNFLALTFFKFTSGVTISGPHAVAVSYCAEFLITRDRARMTIAIGTSIFGGMIVNALLSWLIIPRQWHLGSESFTYNSWRMFLSLCGVPLIIGSVCLYFFPESPKFLMSHGRNEEALEVLRKIYSVNTGQPRRHFPINKLEVEIPVHLSGSSVSRSAYYRQTFKSVVREGLFQMKPLFLGVYRNKLFFVTFIQFCSMFCANTVRLWQPQLFATLRQYYETSHNGEEMTDFCQIIDHATRQRIIQTQKPDEKCHYEPMDTSVYRDTVIISSVTVACLCIAGMLVNWTGNKNLMLICFVIPIGTLIGMNWSSNRWLTLSLTAIYIGLCSATTALIISCIINIFPTTMRTMSVSLSMMSGRIGALMGNVLFPVLLEFGCSYTLLMLGILLAVALICTMYIPKPEPVVQ